MFAQLVAVFAAARLFNRTQKQAASFTMDAAAVITQGKTIFTDLAPLLAAAVGIGLGFKVLSKVKSLWK